MGAQPSVSFEIESPWKKIQTSLIVVTLHSYLLKISVFAVYA
jgi:hypothetical protein